MIVEPIDEGLWPAGDAILCAVYEGEGYVDRGTNLSIAAMPDAGTWLGAWTAAGTLVGVVLLTSHGEPAAVVAQPGEAELRLLAVAPQQRGHGAGRALVLAAETRATAADVTAMAFSTQATMAAARRLYESLGYERAAERDYTRAEREFLVYRKVLRPVTRRRR